MTVVNFIFVYADIDSVVSSVQNDYDNLMFALCLKLLIRNVSV